MDRLFPKKCSQTTTVLEHSQRILSITFLPYTVERKDVLDQGFMEWACTTCVDENCDERECECDL